MKIIQHFEVPYYQFLDEAGDAVADSAAVLQNSESLLAMYRMMVFVRLLDAKAIALQRTGKLGTYPSTRGQEAIFVAVGRAMQAKDVYVPYYRDIGTLIQRGVTAEQLLAYWGGDERGNCFNNGDFPYSVPVGSQPLYATGAAFALKYQKIPQAVLVMAGDGASSQGDFYEALNVAGAWLLPVVFVVCNNQWAISVSREAQTRAATIAQKAIAAGISGEQIDGNDVSAIYERSTAALARAREHFEPTLLEMVCYRQSDHTTADDASRYEPKNKREQEWVKEPVGRLKKYLEKNHGFDAAAEKTVQEECTREVERVVKAYAAWPSQPLTSMFDYLYATLPSIYQPQRDMVQHLEEKRHG